MHFSSFSLLPLQKYIVQLYSSSLSPGELHTGLTDLRVEWDRIALRNLFTGNYHFPDHTIFRRVRKIAKCDY